LGTSKTSNVYEFKKVHLPDGHGNVIEVAGGMYHTIILTDSGKLFAAGDNDSFAMGRNSCSTFRPIKTFVNTKKHEKIINIACGEDHSIFCSNRGYVYVSGENGACGHGSSKPVRKIRRLDTGFKVERAVCGPDYTIFVAGKSLFASGKNDYSQLGSNGREDSNVPIKVTRFPKQFQTRSTLSIAAGPSHVVCLKARHDIFFEEANCRSAKLFRKLLKANFPSSRFYFCTKSSTLLNRCDAVILLCEVPIYDDDAITGTRKAVSWLGDKLGKEGKVPMFLVQHQLPSHGMESRKFCKSLAAGAQAAHFVLDADSDILIKAFLKVVKSNLGDKAYNLEEAVKLLHRYRVHTGHNFSIGNLQKEADEKKESGRRCSIM